MSLEPNVDRRDMSLKKEVSRSPDHIRVAESKTPSPNLSNPNPGGASQIPLNPYQQKLLKALKEKPDIMQLFQVIFYKYPESVLNEYRTRQEMSENPDYHRPEHVRQITANRLKMESYIEEVIARIAGIDVDQLFQEAKDEWLEEQKK